MGQKKRSKATRRSTPILKESEASTSTPLLEQRSTAMVKDASTSTPRLEESITSNPQSEVISTEASTTIVKESQSGVISTKSSISTPRFEEMITEDAILCSIISSLPTKEAVRTSVLSPRWRCIWTRINKVYFDASVLDAQSVGLLCNGSIGQKDKLELLKGKTNQFITSVNSVLRHHQGPRVDEFTIHYYLTKIHSHHLDAWVDFAVKSKTKQLVLHLNKPYFKEMEIEQYLFPFQLLRSSSSLEELTLSSCSLKPPCMFDGLNNLRKLNLFCVDINEEDIHHLLSNCLALEYLNISVAPQLLSLTIPNVSSQFRYLFIKHCDHLREININAVNLDRLHYWGPVVDFVFRQSPHLREATILFQTKVIESNLDFYLNRLTRTLPGIRSLLLHIGGVYQVSDIPKVSHSFMHLTHLDWTWSASIKMSLPCLTTLLDVAPFLESFKLRFTTHLKDRKCFQKKHWERVVEQPPQNLRNLRRRLPKHPLRHIKTVEIYNFYWDKWQIEIVLYLLENAAVLESMTLQKGRSSLTEISEKDIQNLSREFPSNVKLVIL